MTKSAGKRKGGLKSALVSLQSRAHAQSKAALAKEAQDMKGKAARRKIAGSSKQTGKVRHRQPVPFISAWDNTLLIGEGNFSFALSLVQHHRIPGHRITATTYDTEEELAQKYSEAQDNVRLLRDHGVTVLVHVDARSLHKSKALAAQSKRLGGFSRVVWNFPHAGAGIQDQDRNIQVNQQLMLGFFLSVAAFLSGSHDPRDVGAAREGEQDSDVEHSPKQVEDVRARVLVTLRDSVPYTLWEIPQLAKHPPPGHPIYQQLRSYAFDPSSYPGYEHRRTVGGPQSGHNVDLLQDRGPDAESGRAAVCRTWEFALRN